MTQQEMSKLFGISDRTLRNWKHEKDRENLYKLLEKLDLEYAKELIEDKERVQCLKVLNNEEYFSSLRDFERVLYPMMVQKKYLQEWLSLAKDRSLEGRLRVRSAYLYSFLTKKKLKLKLEFSKPLAFYHGNRPYSEDKLVLFYGLRNGINSMRFNQYKDTGGF